jgi:tetratricopeptide (TPR) repeat protein
LHDPNENVVAQGLWVMRNHFQINIDDNQLDTPYSFEANTMAASRVGNWEVAREKAKLWYKDEPFAGRPAVELGFLQAVIFQDYQESVSVLTPALKANEGDLKIINNLAYSLACMGKINEAKEIYSRVNLKQVSDTQRIHLVATAGLIEFRDGNHIEGRKFYEKAASFAGTIRGGELKALVKGYHALEEDRMFAEGASEIKKEATELLSKFKGAVPQWLKGRLEADIDTTGGVLARAIAKGKP